MNLLCPQTRARLCACGLSLLLFALVTGILCMPREQAAPAAQTFSEPLAPYRQDRDRLREWECAQLGELLDDPTADSATRSRAQSRLMDLMKWAGEEADIEAILEARGFEAVLVSVYQDSANVLVRTGDLTQADAALIVELTARQTGLTGGAIKVIPIN